MTQHANECFKSKNTFKSDFYFYVFAIFSLPKKVGKKHVFFVIFSKKIIFGQK